MSQPRIRANDTNTGIIYITHSGDEIEIPIENFDPEMTNTNDPDYHNYDETSNIPGSENVNDQSIIERNFLEEPAPTFGLWDTGIPVSNGDISFGVPVGNVTHYVTNGPNGEVIIVNVTNENEHFLDPGIVVRELYQDSNGQSHINDTGAGTGRLGDLNESLADFVWQNNADRIGRESVYEDVNGVPPTPTHEPLLPLVLEAIPPQIVDALSPRDDAPGVNVPGAGGGGDPLVLDMNGDGQISLTSVENGVYFDIWGDGFARRTGWVAPEDGMLALDQNGNGTIDDLSELFGSERARAANDNKFFMANREKYIEKRVFNG